MSTATKEDPHVTHLPESQDPEALEAAQILSRETRRNKLEYYAVIKFPLITRPAVKKTEDDITLYSPWMSRPTSTNISRL